MKDNTEYKSWKQTYSNEDFDRTQSLAYILTDADRAAGKPAPTCGYSKSNFDLARTIVLKAKA